MLTCPICGITLKDRNVYQRHFSVKKKSDIPHQDFKKIQIGLAEDLFLSDRENNMDKVLDLNPQIKFTPKTLHEIWKNKYGSDALNTRRVEVGNKTRIEHIYKSKKYTREKDLDKQCPVCDYRYKNVNSISHHISMKIDWKHVEFMNDQKEIAGELFNESGNTFKVLEKHPEFTLSERVLIRFWRELYGQDRIRHRQYITSSESRSGIMPWNNGLTKENSDGLAKLSETKKKQYKDPYKGEQSSLMKKEYSSGKRTAVIFSEESKNNISKKLIEGHVSGRIKLSHGKHGHLPAESGYEAHSTRSTWETNVALILRKLKIDYKYEPKVFPLYDKSENLIDSYTPDFYLTTKDKWYEIKGVFKSAKDWSGVHKNFQGNITKLNMFKEQYPEEYAKLRIIGKKEYALLTKRFKSKIPNWESGRK